MRGMTHASRSSFEGDRALLLAVLAPCPSLMLVDQHILMSRRNFGSYQRNIRVVVAVTRQELAGLTAAPAVTHPEAMSAIAFLMSALVAPPARS
jgi:hypothetical protein